MPVIRRLLRLLRLLRHREITRKPGRPTDDLRSSRARRPRRRWLRELSVLELVMAAAVFLAADVADQLVGDSILLSGMLDETAHVLTTLIVLWALGGPLWDRMLYPALVASVAIDLDHIPQELCYFFLTEGTPRPYTHSLLTIAAVLAGALLWRRRRDLLLGIAVGVTLHLWRDMAEPRSGVALLWPLSDGSFSISQYVYLALMAAALVCGIRRSERRSRLAKARA